MSRFSHGAFAAGAPRRGRWPVLTLAVGSLAIVAALAGTSAAKVPSTTVVLGQTATVPDPSCPGLPCQAVGSVTGFQVSNGQTRSALHRPQQRHDQGLDPDPGPADQQTALLLQRLLRHPAGGPPRDPAPRARHQPAALQPAQPGLDQGPQPLPRPDGQVRLLAEGRKGRHRRPHRPHLGPRLRPGTPLEQRLASQPRPRHLHQLHRHPPGRTPAKARHPRHLRLPLLNRAPALHGDAGRG